MPIPIETLSQNFIVIEPTTTVADLRRRLKSAQDLWTFIVIALEGNEFAVLRLPELVSILQSKPEHELKPLYELALSETLTLSCPYVTTPLEIGLFSRRQAERIVSGTPGKRKAVLSEGSVVGVLAIESRTIIPAPDLTWLDERCKPETFLAGELLGIDLNLTGKGQSSCTVTTEPFPAGTLTVSIKDELEIEQRWINAEIIDTPPGTRLEIGKTYTLAFDVDTTLRTNSLARDGVFNYQYGDQEEIVELTVQLSSSDLEIYTKPQKLDVPRSGKSKGKAIFDISPKHDREAIVNAVFLKDGNFIQLVTLKLNSDVKDTIPSKSMSRPLESAFEVQPRDLGLVITNTGTGFKLILTGSVCAEANLALTSPQLDQMIAQVRSALREVVNLECGPNKVRAYQQAIDISPEVNGAVLKHLAEAGYLLFQQMFYGDSADAQSHLLGDRLIEIAQRQTLKIQIVSQQFLLPWSLLYLVKEFDPEKIDPERFLGFKHIIEHIPLQPSMQVVDSVINSQPELSVSLNMNCEIDSQMGQPLTAEQLTYWKKLSQAGRAQVVIRQTGEEVEEALAQSSTNEQIVYFYCHAISRSLSEGGGPDASTLQLAGKALTLRNLKLRAPTTRPLTGAPLVFINACESAELSPLFYGGFVPYFMTKGARGVIGTECETPALFAREWARRFFDTFLSGEPLGKTFLDLRREFFYQHNNVMGLLYAVYCDGDTQVVPGVDVVN